MAGGRGLRVRAWILGLALGYRAWLLGVALGRPSVTPVTLLHLFLKVSTQHTAHGGGIPYYYTIYYILYIYIGVTGVTVGYNTQQK